MWKDMPLVEGDMETRVDMERRMSNRLREAEQWRLVRGTRHSRKASDFVPGDLLNRFAATLRTWLAGPPEPGEQCC
jgi:hypothetical protein